MNSPHPPSDNPELDALIAQYLEAVDRGERPDRQQLMEAHPEQAAELASFFDIHDKLQAANEQARPEFAKTLLAPQGSLGTKPGTLIGGRYKLLENIGEGGMGSVWVAEQQQPVKRRVAIKLIKAGMDSRQVLARFDAERQALAVMDHPNIAKVFDGGMTEQGRPYFVMEYVKGVPFTEYCDKARLSLKDRLILFIPVCQAVQHAHHKGIVHRDLKPSNILICLYDGRPVPKVIDFGLAKAMHQSLTDQSIFTGHGVMVGTPLYMSPEQAEHNNLDVDTRTDIYSLGVVLYELLTGTTPLERQQLQQAAFEEVRRLIQEVEPPRPSIRLSGSAGLPSIAAQRSIDPKQLSRSLAGDLDWIVMKALEKERSRRYETATGLARDIERFLNEEAVEACPPSRSYRLKKFLRKHRGQVIAASVVLLALIVGITGTTWGLIHATKAEQAATESEHKTLEALEQVTQERDAKELERKKAEAAATAERTAKLAESEQRTKAERQLVSGILRPIGFNTEGLDPAELKSLTDWSGLEDSRLQLLALEVAFEDPATALRVARRSERVIQSCVGLSPTRRAKAIDFVTAKQRDIKTDARIRLAACLFALELGSTDIPTLEESVRLSPRFLRDEFIAFPPKGKESQQQLIGNAMIAVVEESTDAFASSFAWDVIVVLAPQFSSEQMTRAGDAMIAELEMLEKVTESWGWLQIRVTNKVPIAFAARLSPKQTKRGGNALIAVLEKSTYQRTLEAAGNALAALAPQLSPEQTMRGWDTLIAVLKRSAHPSASEAARNALAALAPRLSPEQTTRGWDALIVVLENATDQAALSAAGDALAALAPRLSSEQTTRGCDALIAVLEMSTDGDALRAAGNALAALAPKLSPEQIMRAGDGVIALLENSTDQTALSAAGDALATLALRLSSEQTTRGWDALIGVLEKSVDGDALRAAGNALAALAPKLSPVQIMRAGDGVIALLENSMHWLNSRAAKKMLDMLAPRLSPEQTMRCWNAVIAQFNNLDAEKEKETFVVLAHCLSPEQTTREWDAMITVLEKSMDWTSRVAAGHALAALASRLNPEQTTRGWDSLIAVLETNEDALYFAQSALVALAPGLSSEQRLRTAKTLVESWPRINNGYYTSLSAESLASIIRLLEPMTRDRISTAASTILLDYRATSAEYFVVEGVVTDYSSLRHASISMSQPKSLARLLSHPGCVAETREWMLQRLEELLFHDGKPVFLTKPEPETEAQPSPQTRAEPPPRRFHNLHDAAAWIQQNWPDFDLETNHPVTWRSQK